MKNPFTNAGLQELQNDFLTLPDGQKIDECIAILDDFKGWVLRHFDLNRCQRLCLLSLNDEFIRVLAFYTGLAVDYNVPITIVEECLKSFENEEHPETMLTIEPGIAFSTLVKKAKKMPQEAVNGNLTIRITSLETPE
jgi:hypothetical protein